MLPWIPETVKFADEETFARDVWPDTLRVDAWTPETVKFADEETFAKEVWPEILRVLPWTFETVMLVPDAFVNFKVAIVPEGLRSSVEETTPRNWSQGRVCPLEVVRKSEEVAVKDPLSLYWSCPGDPATAPPVDVLYLFPCASESFAIVPEGLLTSVEETIPEKTRELEFTWSFVEELVWKTR